MEKEKKQKKKALLLNRRKYGSGDVHVLLLVLVSLLCIVHDVQQQSGNTNTNSCCFAYAQQRRTMMAIPYQYYLAWNATETTPTFRSALNVVEDDTVAYLADALGDSDVVRVLYTESGAIGEFVVLCFREAV